MVHHSPFSRPVAFFLWWGRELAVPAIAVRKKRGESSDCAWQGYQAGRVPFSSPCQPPWLVEASDDSPYSRFPPPRSRLYGLRGGLSAAGSRTPLAAPRRPACLYCWSPAQQRTRPSPFAAPHHHTTTPANLARPTGSLPLSSLPASFVPLPFAGTWLDVRSRPQLSGTSRSLCTQYRPGRVLKSR
jgi:hypothetical protein